VSFDAQDYRRRSLAGWEEAAAGWTRNAEQVRRFSAPVSCWLIEASDPRPGQRVLELAAGLGETGMLAAQLVGPGGGVIISDQAEEMLAGARARAGELALSNVEFQTLNAEWIDLPLASVDVVLCRWGYMLMADPAAALSESRRVLRPGGRIALAVWDEIEANPWAGLPALELRGRGLAPAPDGTPGPFALSDRGRVRELLEQAGFTDVMVDALDLTRRHPNFEELWETTLDLSRSFRDAVLSRPDPEPSQIEASLRERFAPFTAQDGSLEVPARALVAAGDA
jgi:SAM-dependent methyltransferase